MNPKSEPVLAVVGTLVVSAIGLLVAFGVALTEAQTFAIVQFVEVALGLAVLVRSRVTPSR